MTYLSDLAQGNPWGFAFVLGSLGFILAAAIHELRIGGKQ